MLPVILPGMSETKKLDCVVCGSCVLDFLCRPVSLTKPIGEGVLHHVDPIMPVGGGITLNSGFALARLGLKVGIFTYVGQDKWGPFIQQLCEAEGIDTQTLLTREGGATSTTFVAIDPSGERSFFHCVGATKLMDGDLYRGHMDRFRSSRMALLGYYSMFGDKLEADLPEVLKEIRAQGCQTAMDAAGDGGRMSPLDRMLPHLDVYVPSHGEAMHQTGREDPRQIIAAYRDCGAPGILGVKLGTKGVMLSPKKGEYLEVGICAPPGDVVDTTGAGDNFYAGLLAGLLKGLDLEKAAKLGAAAAACCVTSLGGSTGGRDYATTAKLAGI